MKTSESEVHFRVCPNPIQAASLGLLQLSLGNTLPPRSAIADLTWEQNSGKDGLYKKEVANKSHLYKHTNDRQNKIVHNS